MRTEKLLQGFQREHTQGTDHTETGMLHPGILTWGVNLPPTVPCPWPGRIAVYAGKARAGSWGWQQPPVPPPRLLHIPSAAAARGWEQVPFSLTGLGAPRL